MVDIADGIGMVSKGIEALEYWLDPGSETPSEPPTETPSEAVPPAPAGGDHQGGLSGEDSHCHNNNSYDDDNRWPISAPSPPRAAPPPSGELSPSPTTDFTSGGETLEDETEKG